EPVSSGLVLLTLIPLRKNIKAFYRVQTKKDTFILSVKNFVLVNLILVLSIAGTLLIEVLYK
ncbi:MAG: 1,4-dihydroxy-2-naphthoate polyprenyltransferase, partial [Bacillota bacterium]|nr:1,4-dihydroxy-2-naphthoate polyprenyltransferase [Bacillota bacterium]